MNILITGSRGQLGSELCTALLLAKNDVGAIPSRYANARVDTVDRSELDIVDSDAVKSWFAAHDPYDIVFNCAAYTDVDGCESNEADAYAVNAAGVANLARACCLCDAVLVHVSTDYVFSGLEAGARTEVDECAPISAYGRTKLAGEKLAVSNNPRTHIVRTAWLYGRTGGNFVRTMMKLGTTYDEVSVVDDQIGNPTNAADLAHAMLEIALSDSFGIWHATCQGECTWADFAEAIMDEFGLSCRVLRCSTQQWLNTHPGTAQRPAFSSLDNAKLRYELRVEMRPWRDALKAFAAQCQKERECEKGIQ